MGKLWTEEEKQFVIENCGSMTSRKLATLLPMRSVDAVHRRRYLLRKEGRILPSKRWSPDEADYLKKNYGGKTYEQMINEKLTKRTLDGIKYKASALGIRLSLRYIEPPNYNFSDYEKGFLVGMLEGEGNISIQLGRNRRRLSPILEISNTNIDLIKAVQNIIGGTIYPSKRENQGYKTCYLLKLLKIGEIYGVLKVLQPYLISKKERAILMLKFLESRLERWRTQGTCAPYSSTEKRYANLMRAINYERNHKIYEEPPLPTDQVLLIHQLEEVE